MRQPAIIALAFLLLPAALPPGAGIAASAPPISVSHQGMLMVSTPPMTRVSPFEDWTLQIVPTRVGFEGFDTDAILRGPDGATRRLTGLTGNPLCVNDRGRIVTLLTTESASNPSVICVVDPDGREVYRREISNPVNPALSPDGTRFACGTRRGLFVLDLSSLTETVLPAAELFALGANGNVAAWNGRGIVAGGLTFALDAPPRKIAFAKDEAILVLDARALLRIDPATGVRSVLHRAPRGSELQDVIVRPDGSIALGVRTLAGGTFAGEIVMLGEDGAVQETVSGPRERITHGEAGRDENRGIPWPTLPNSQHSVGNTWGEFQNYGGAPYPHPGIDVMGTANQPVYAVRNGVVKAILTTSGEWHWRVAIADTATTGTSKGYLYAHLSQPTIAVHVGDVVTAGQLLGGLVQWPSYDFTHCHFARIEKSGSSWADGQWMAIENPHLQITNQSETTAPVFEPARGTDLLAFCANQTSTYQSPTALHGPVDIICHVGDRIVSTWVCSVQQIRYTIYPLGVPSSPVVNDKEAVYCNFSCDTYLTGQNDLFMCNLLYKQDTVCHTYGDYDYREFFHIITNSNGDRTYTQSDQNECWDTSALPDRSWVIKVTAVDVVGNATTDSMIVTTANGNPSAVEGDPAAGLVFALDPSRPNPMRRDATIRFRIPAAEHVSITVLDLSGRIVRTLCDRDLPAGAHAVEWDGRDARGADTPAGMYFYRLEGPDGTRTRKLLRVR
jgi:murein DD-endopeptidase MepM/ murein hydrolase activator NlpD